MIPNILQILTQAIRERRCVALRYHEQRQVRVIEPHVIYISERGELVLDGFQTRGYSSSGRLPPFWRPFRLKEISAVSVLKEGFSVRTLEGYSPTKQRYHKGLIAAVEAVPAVTVPEGLEFRRPAVVSHPVASDFVGPQPLRQNPHRR